MARTRVALAGLVAVVLPLLFLTAVDVTTPLTVAMVAVVLAALVRLTDDGAPFASRLLAVRPRTAGAPEPVPSGHVTDPEHHPLRPRAPGLV